MKRRTTQPKKLRDRRSGMSPYRRHNKIEYKYTFKKVKDPAD